MYKEYIPFYLTYPLPLFYEEEDTYMRDYAYFTSLYGEQSKRYERYVKDYLWRTMGAESFLYDEYPDSVQLQWLVERIWEEIPKQENLEQEKMDKRLEQMNQGKLEEDYQRKIEDEKELIEVILYHTIIHERMKRNQPIIKKDIM